MSVGMRIDGSLLNSPYSTTRTDPEVAISQAISMEFKTYNRGHKQEYKLLDVRFPFAVNRFATVRPDVPPPTII